MPARHRLTFRSDHGGDPAAWRAFADLLHDTFGIDITILDALGGPDPTLAPFGWFDAAGTCVASLCAFSMPLVIGGTFVRGAGLQSGAVRPQWRRQGLFRDLIGAALNHCAAEGFEAVALLTDTSALYTPFGFRPLPLYRFEGPPPSRGAAAGARPLNLRNDADITLLRRLLDARRPVADRFAPLRQVEMFLFNAALAPDIRLAFMADSTAAIAWRAGDGGLFDLVDIVGPTIPPLADILAALDLSPTRIVTRFSPDHLDWQGKAVAESDRLTLMMRGAEALIPPHPCGLSPLAEF